MPAPDLELLTRAALEAGEIAMRHFRAAPEVWDKAGGQGPVSEADLEVDRALQAILRDARPGYGWVSEESATDRPGAERVFIVDPIDGTRAFLDGNETFAHALAVVERGRVVSAVVYLPARDRLFAAALAQGATLNGEPIRCSDTARIGGARILANRATFEAQHWPGGSPEAERAYRPSLAYRLCLVAQGRFDAMITLRDAWEWDIAAGTLIVREAGGVVTDGLGREPAFVSHTSLHQGCIAAPPSLHAQLMSRRAVA